MRKSFSLVHTLLQKVLTLQGTDIPESTRLASSLLGPLEIPLEFFPEFSFLYIDQANGGKGSQT